MLLKGAIVLGAPEACLIVSRSSRLLSMVGSPARTVFEEALGLARPGAELLCERTAVEHVVAMLGKPGRPAHHSHHQRRTGASLRTGNRRRAAAAVRGQSLAPPGVLATGDRRGFDRGPCRCGVRRRPARCRSAIPGRSRRRFGMSRLTRSTGIVAVDWQRARSIGCTITSGRTDFCRCGARLTTTGHHLAWHESSGSAPWVRCSFSRSARRLLLRPDELRQHETRNDEGSEIVEEQVRLPAYRDPATRRLALHR